MLSLNLHSISTHAPPKQYLKAWALYILPYGKLLVHIINMHVCDIVYSLQNKNSFIFLET